MKKMHYKFNFRIKNLILKVNGIKYCLKKKLKRNKFTYYIFKPILDLFRKLQKLWYFNYSFIQWYRLSKRKLIKLELGSGIKKGTNGWVTVDMGGADIFWDLRKSIPLNDFTVDNIYSSHLLEHIPYKDLITFLKRCRRLLKEEGSFSVCVPSAGKYINAYIKGEVFIEKEKCWPNGIVDTGSKLDQLNYIAYMGGEHNYMFDEENLINTLRKAGFKKVKVRKFDPDIDIEGRDFESIYAVGYK